MKVNVIYTFLPDRTVMSPKAVIAPRNTVRRGCRIAIMAAMKKVLSPNSDTMITDTDAMNA
jgi:hypothetical protein